MKSKATLLIDDHCTFCNNSVAFIVRHGGEQDFNFVSIYSEDGKKHLVQHGLPENYDESLVLISKGKSHLKSDAVLRIARRLNSMYPLLYWLKVLPGPLRDAVYSFVAKHRHTFT